MDFLKFRYLWLYGSFWGGNSQNQEKSKINLIPLKSKFKLIHRKQFAEAGSGRILIICP